MPVLFNVFVMGATPNEFLSWDMLEGSCEFDFIIIKKIPFFKRK